MAQAPPIRGRDKNNNQLMMGAYDKEGKGGKAMAMGIRVAGDKEGDGIGNKVECNKESGGFGGKNDGNKGGKRAPATRVMALVTVTTKEGAGGGNDQPLCTTQQ